MAIQDLKHYEFTSEQDHQKAVDNGRKGGLASGEARAKAKTYREIFAALRDMEVNVPMPDGTKQLRRMDEAEMIALHRQAALGSTKALKLVLQLAGELVDTVNVTGDGINIVVRSEEEAEKLRNIGEIDA